MNLHQGRLEIGLTKGRFIGAPSRGEGGGRRRREALPSAIIGRIIALASRADAFRARDDTFNRFHLDRALSAARRDATRTFQRVTSSRIPLVTERAHAR